MGKVVFFYGVGDGSTCECGKITNLIFVEPGVPGFIGLCRECLANGFDIKTIIPLYELYAVGVSFCDTDETINRLVYLCKKCLWVGEEPTHSCTYRRDVLL